MALHADDIEPERPRRYTSTYEEHPSRRADNEVYGEILKPNKFAN